MFMSCVQRESCTFNTALCVTDTVGLTFQRLNWMR